MTIEVVGRPVEGLAAGVPSQRRAGGGLGRMGGAPEDGVVGGGRL
jgi:hypothetical protein